MPASNQVYYVITRYFKCLPLPWQARANVSWTRHSPDEMLEQWENVQIGITHENSWSMAQVEAVLAHLQSSFTVSDVAYHKGSAKATLICKHTQLELRLVFLQRVQNRDRWYYTGPDGRYLNINELRNAYLCSYKFQIPRKRKIPKTRRRLKS